MAPYARTGVNLTAAQKRSMLKQIRAGKKPNIRLSKPKRGGKIKRKKSGKGLKLSGQKKGGVLPLLLPILAGLGSLGATAGGAAAIAKAVNDAKSNARQLAELKRHNERMEAAVALRKGSGVKKKKTANKKRTNKNRGRGFYLSPPFQ
jgi:hypothetical protein